MEADRVWRGILTELIRADTRALCAAPWSEERPEFAPLLECLLECVRFHARSLADLALAELVNRLRQAPAHLKGDVLRDLVLASALAAKDERAHAIFLMEYGPMLKGMWIKRQYLFRVRDEEGYLDLLPKLLGVIDPPGRLAKYRGESSLRGFLGSAFANLILDERKRDARHRPTPGTEPQSPAPELALIDNECFDLVRAAIKRFCLGLASEDQVCLRLYFQEFQERDTHHGIGKAVAALMRRAPGTVSRRLARIEDTLRSHFGAQTPGELHECLHRLLAVHGAGIVAAFSESLTPCAEDT